MGHGYWFNLRFVFIFAQLVTLGALENFKLVLKCRLHLYMRIGLTKFGPGLNKKIAKSNCLFQTNLDGHFESTDFSQGQHLTLLYMSEYISNWVTIILRWLCSITVELNCKFLDLNMYSIFKACTKAKYQILGFFLGL